MYISNIKELKRILKINKNIIDKEGRNLYFYIKNKEMFDLCRENSVPIKNDNEDNTPLFFCEDPILLNLFLDYGISSKYKNIHGQNALFFSNAKCSEILLNNGVDVNEVDQQGNNALIYAEKVPFKGGEFKNKVQLLIDNNIEIKHVNQKGIGYINQVNYLTPELIKLFLEHQVSFDTTRRFSGKHLLESCEHLIEELPEKELSDINFSAIRPNGNPLLLNVINNFKTIKKIRIIEKDINIINSNNENILFFIDKISLFKKIIDQSKIDIHVINSNNQNVLFSSNMTKEKVKILLNKGIDYNHKDNNNFTPFLYHLNEYNKYVKEKDKKSKYKKKYDFHIDCACVLLDHQLRNEQGVPENYSVREDLLKEQIISKKQIIINEMLLDKYILLGQLAPTIKKLKNRL